jgi:hypothetical protein
MSGDPAHRAWREARREAAPFAAMILVANVALALVSRQAGWELFGSDDWWVWLVVSAPSAVLVATFSIGPGRIGLGERRRELAIVLLALLGLGTGAGIVCVVVTLAHWAPGGLQLLASAGVVLFTNVVTFALVFWELDEHGPVARRLAAKREHPDFQFPQDENPQLARPGWAPALVDYVYLSVTNSIAFSPTDAMPLTPRAKLFMALEAGVSALTILVVAARAINILGS